MKKVSLPNSKALKLMKHLVASAAFLGAGVAGAYAGDVKPVPEIIVTGSGKVSAKPDMAIINIGVNATAPTAKEALEKNNASMTEVIKKIKDLGILEHDIQTSGLYIYKQTAKDDDSKVLGYNVSDELTVSVRDLTKLGALYDEAVDMGANHSAGLKFRNVDPRPYLTEAREKAVHDAIEKAQTLAKSANVKLGKVIKITEDSSSPYPMSTRSGFLLATSGSSRTPMEAGQLDYNVDVSVNFEIL